LKPVVGAYCGLFTASDPHNASTAYYAKRRFDDAERVADGVLDCTFGASRTVGGIDRWRRIICVDSRWSVILSLIIKTKKGGSESLRCMSTEKKKVRK